MSESSETLKSMLIGGEWIARQEAAFASTNPATGALEPNDLAKVYMWNRAARASTTNPAQLAELDRIDTLVMAVMPPAWQPDLDRKVADHLAKFASQSPTKR